MTEQLERSDYGLMTTIVSRKLYQNRFLISTIENNKE